MTLLGPCILSLALQLSPSVESPLVASPDGLLRLDGPRAAQLDGRARVALTGLAIPGLESRVAQLERLPTSTHDAELWIDGEPVGPLHGSIASDLTLWRGSLDGDEGGDVFLAFSSHGSRGWVHAEGRLWHLLAQPDAERGWEAAGSRWVDDADVRGLVTEKPLCEALETPGRPAPVIAPEPAEASFSGAPLELYQARVAVETDFQYYELFGDATAATEYILTLFGAMSDTYRAELGTRVDVAYLGLYTSNNDPWENVDNGFGSIDVLYEFQEQWRDGWPVEADLAHLVSGGLLGGGVAWVNVLGVADYAYAVSGNLAGLTPFPIAQGPLNWDYIVTSHETGHNFGTGHTHDYCPPLDECAPDGYFGQCQTQALCVEGTIMSYCHLCGEGIANVRPEFHPTVRQVLRDTIVQSALRPFEGIDTTDLGGQLAGSTFEPTLNVAYDPELNELASTGSDLPQGLGGIAIVGFQNQSVPFFSGTLVPTVNLIVPFVADSDPYTVQPAYLSSAFPFGVDLYYQYWVQAPAAFDGVVATNGVEVTLYRPTPPAGLSWVQHPTNGLEYAIGDPATWFHSLSLSQQSGGTLAAIDTAALETWLVDNLFGGVLPGDE
ncbi:MAG: M12 family metallo-peptidase, partial [Planctomycetota bacterium]